MNEQKRKLNFWKWFSLIFDIFKYPEKALEILTKKRSEASELETLIVNTKALVTRYLGAMGREQAVLAEVEIKLIDKAMEQYRDLQADVGEIAERRYATGANPYRIESILTALGMRIEEMCHTVISKRVRKGFAESISSTVTVKFYETVMARDNNEITSLTGKGLFAALQEIVLAGRRLLEAGQYTAVPPLFERTSDDGLGFDELVGIEAKQKTFPQMIESMLKISTAMRATFDEESFLLPNAVRTQFDKALKEKWAAIEAKIKGVDYLILHTLVMDYFQIIMSGMAALHEVAAQCFANTIPVLNNKVTVMLGVLGDVKAEGLLSATALEKVAEVAQQHSGSYKLDHHERVASLVQCVQMLESLTGDNSCLVMGD